MKTDHSLLRFAQISLVGMFLVVIAGSIVRVTGSGMGCPDWPKCFGYLVPPTDAEPITFREGKSFQKGQMVLFNDTLWVANAPIAATVNFDHSEWHKYPKHDHALFNPVQTWIEYINRLCTALFAIPVLILCALSVRRFRRSKDFITLLLAMGSLFMIGFEAWLGKLVVDGNLSSGSITLHMIGSLSIVVFLLAIINRLTDYKTEYSFGKPMKGLIVFFLFLSFAQVLLGTQVREEVDVLSGAVSDRSQWIDLLTPVFKIHRSFSILVVLVAVVIYVQHRRSPVRYVWIDRMLMVVVLEIIAGVVLAYFSMPSFIQPMHLFFAVVLFALQVYLVLRLFGKRKSVF